MAGRDLPAELATFTEALTLKFSVAQRLLNGDDEDFAIIDLCINNGID
jgi:hypothetical protein